MVRRVSGVSFSIRTYLGYREESNCRPLVAGIRYWLVPPKDKGYRRIPKTRSSIRQEVEAKTPMTSQPTESPDKIRGHLRSANQSTDKMVDPQWDSGAKALQRVKIEIGRRSNSTGHREGLHLIFFPDHSDGRSQINAIQFTMVSVFVSNWQRWRLPTGNKPKDWCLVKMNNQFSEDTKRCNCQNWEME